jgi:hypothetical protein
VRVSFSPGRERVALVGVTSTDQNGSVPRATYDAHVRAPLGIRISAETHIGTLGYGLGSAFSVFDIQEERMRSVDMMMSIRIKEK